jgi:hypothetical protein
MADTTRPVEERIKAAVERMQRIQAAAKGLRETGQLEPTQPRTVEPQSPKR